MKKGEKLKNFLKHPGVWLWAFYAALAFFGAACIIIAVLWNGENPVALLTVSSWLSAINPTQIFSTLM